MQCDEKGEIHYAFWRFSRIKFNARLMQCIYDDIFLNLKCIKCAMCILWTWTISLLYASYFLVLVFFCVMQLYFIHCSLCIFALPTIKIFWIIYCQTMEACDDINHLHIWHDLDTFCERRVIIWYSKCIKIFLVKFWQEIESEEIIAVEWILIKGRRSVASHEILVAWSTI